ncbi:MBL fold metallo-hydrolase [Thermosynechococcus sp. JY1334]|uniref:MBL fold metallo-hydrolase n=1 Tax=unclassified Thermosynechococcus TaxID=2622553 RepID=UPI002671F7BB|nr:MULTISPECIES: MBL fold metallo-hydrolase [unclassified Thermosynechococcus]MDR7899086.1 MBL fold metallo-hydrolase [Thermosynechococcus sp. JY1332]MDR7906493.1 MBL fold metallo-hydrolase [Thermosynechococcus sp. JY1334]WKT86209.1 MBL fold metallo-hydrolase [Thermosynechococcus sp. JY1339]WNC55154.1 MBL fold metallo-hydrolase [Thermosynechococcus sp. JY1331]
MERRQFLRWAQVGAIASLSGHWAAHAQGGGLSLQWFGHTCFLFTGSGQRVLVNPFRPIGCTKGLRPPRVAADIVMISSRLLDEGYIEGLPGRPKLLFQPGSYKVNGLSIQGIRTSHDRVGGFRFGVNVVWRWQQGGINLLHMGGIAMPITIEQRILMGRPDVMIVPVGGSDKAYTAEEAKAAIEVLQPRLVIPSHYRTAAADPNNCDLTGLEDFLKVMEGTPVRRSGGASLSLSAANLPQNTTIQVLSI